MLIELEIKMDVPTAKKFVAMMEGIKEDCEFEDEEELSMIDGLISSVKEKLPK